MSTKTDAVATPSIRVPVRVEATDDYGITRVVWLRGLNPWSPPPAASCRESNPAR